MEAKKLPNAKPRGQLCSSARIEFRVAELRKNGLAALETLLGGTIDDILKTQASSFFSLLCPSN